MWDQTWTCRDAHVATKDVKLTDNHNRKLKASANTLAVNLIGQVGETNIAVELFADCRLGRRSLSIGVVGCGCTVAIGRGRVGNRRLGHGERARWWEVRREGVGNQRRRVASAKSKSRGTPVSAQGVRAQLRLPPAFKTQPFSVSEIEWLPFLY